MSARYPVGLTRKPFRQQTDGKEEFKKLLALITSKKGLEPAAYALLGLVIFLVVISAVMASGTEIAGLYTEIGQAFSTPL
jgi:hypothetical protein